MLLLPVHLLSFVFSLAVSADEGIRRLDGSMISVAEAEAFARTTLEKANVTGAQIAIKDTGRLVWSAAFGIRTLEPRQPMTIETATWAASITKGVFATYVMQLVERGEFLLDKPVATQLPRPLDSYEPYREKGTAIVNDRRWKLVTPRMLLSHTAGLENFAFLEPDKKMHLHGKPGKEYRYSGEGLNLVQYVIEQQKQRGLTELMREAIFEPVGMRRTAMVHRKDLEENVADRFGGNGQFLAKTRRAPARAAGSMVTTAEDLVRYASALFDGRLVKAETRAEMLRPQVRIRTLHQFGPGGEKRGREAARVGLAYGMGWGLLTRTRFGPAFFKEGHGDGAQNYMICFERRRACMVLLTNSDNGEAAFRALMERIFGNTETPWEWEGYTAELIEARRRNQ
ncbi:MAG: beta-lactamase family protein [Acidobacteria bacterium]|nr:beta-lactamase family protein [Acidobacteriota bacterium]